MPKVLLVHGIRNTPWKKNPMQGLYKELRARGVCVEVVDYGYVFIPVTNSRAVSAIKKQAADGDIIVGYSNGLYAAAQSAEEGLACTIIGISGALDKGWEFPEWVRRVINLYNKKDSVLTQAKRWAWMTNWLPWRWWRSDADHGWGNMGQRGYKGPSGFVKNVSLPDESVGHSWHKDRKSVNFAAKIIEEEWLEVRNV